MYYTQTTGTCRAEYANFVTTRKLHDALMECTSNEADWMRNHANTTEP
jgi:hypothetical protein